MKLTELLKHIYSHTQQPKQLKRLKKSLLSLLLGSGLLLTSCSIFSLDMPDRPVSAPAEITEAQAETTAAPAEATAAQAETTAAQAETTEAPAVVPDTNISAEEAGLNFIKNDFSPHSSLQDTGMLSSECGPGFLEAYKFRKSILQKRREAFGNQKQLTNVTIDKSYVSEAGNLAFVVLQLKEDFYYLDEPDRPAALRSTYAMLLDKSSGSYKVLWATGADGMSRMMQGWDKNYLYNKGIFVPFVDKDKDSEVKTIFDVDLHNFSAEAVKKACIDNRYEDLQHLGSLETAVINKELAAVQKHLPPLEDKPGPGQHLLDRAKIKEYMERWAMSRNEEWPDFSPYGGDCTNFASQIWNEAGVPMTEKWHFKSWDERTGSWGTVPRLTEYVLNNTGQGPNGEKAESWTQLSPGDLAMIDWSYDGDPDHATVIYSGGPQARFSAHSGDADDVRVSDVLGDKVLVHIKYYTE